MSRDNNSQPRKRLGSAAYLLAGIPFLQFRSVSVLRIVMSRFCLVFLFCFRRFITNSRGGEDMCFAHDIQDSASTSYFYVPYALDLPSQGALNRRPGHRVGRPAEFNSRPNILTRGCHRAYRNPVPSVQLRLSLAHCRNRGTDSLARPRLRPTSCSVF
jgi:hypothetical protein